MQVPRLEKISVNIGVGDATQDPKLLEVSVKELELITGQKAAITKSKKAISNFKLRQGIPIGARVTLRGKTMYEFFDRLVATALPRIRDFRGLSPRKFDGRGSYTLGIREQIIFPEISFDKIDAIRGMDVTIVTSARNDEEGRALLREMGMPFRSN
jgi:large subunit ribosomal protein L5